MTKKKKKAPKRDRGRTFLLDLLPDELWLAAQAKAASQGRKIKWVILQLLAKYVKDEVEP